MKMDSFFSFCFFFLNSSMSYVRLKGLHFFWPALLQGEPCLEVMGYDKKSVASPSMLTMLIDLKVTNGIHSSEFAKPHNMPPNQMESTGRHTSQSLDWGNINLLPLNIIIGRKQEVGYENIYVWFQIEVVVAHQLRPLVLSKRKLAGFALQLGMGFATLLVPTSALLMIVLTYLDVPYKNWLSYIWKFALSLLVALFIIMLIMVSL